MNEIRPGSYEREAVREILASKTFARADQLRNLLEFICAQTLAGRGVELTEYVVGVEALGRKPDYDPAADPVVRNRAHALRKKIDEYYTRENPGAKVRVHLPKGSYAVVFEPAAGNPANKDDRTTRRWALAGVLFALGVGAGYWGRGRFGGERKRVPGVMLEFWGPLLSPEGSPTICIGSPAHLFVRPHVTKRSLISPDLSAKDLLPWYRQNRNLPSANELFLLPTTNSALWGDAAAAITIGRMLTGAGVMWQYVPERVTPLASLRKKNLVVLGRPEYSVVASTLLKDAPLTVDFEPAAEECVVRDRTPGEGAEKTLRMELDAKGEPNVVYGLVTVMRSLGGADGERTVVISGTNSAGSQAAAEFITSAEQLRVLKDRVAEGRGGAFPESYQVVVKASSSATIPLTIQYVRHRVMEKSGSVAR